MIETRKRYQKIVDKIKISMIKSGDKIWIKISPIVRKFFPTNLQFILNDECYNFEIYDINGIEAHKIYFKGVKCNPSFYIKSEKNNYRIDFGDNGIIANPISNINNINNHIKKNCNFKSSNSCCWAKAVYYTSRPEKTPFDEM